MPILPGHRRRGEDVEVAGQPHRRHRAARARCTGGRCAARRGDGRLVRAAGRRAPAGGRRRRATPSARWRARSWSASTAPRRPRAGRGALRPRRSCSSEAPEEIEELAVDRRRRRAVHLPGARSPTASAVALGGAAAAGPGRREARRRAAGAATTSTCRASASTARSCRSASATSAACGCAEGGRRWPSTRACCAWRPPATARSSTSPRACGRSSSAPACEPGVAAVFAVGATVGVTTIEYEPGAVADLQALLDRLIAPEGDYRHNALNHDTNAHSHLRAALIGPSETIPDRRRRAGPGDLAAGRPASTSTTARASGSSRCRSCPDALQFRGCSRRRPARRDLLEGSRKARYTRRSAPVAACVRSRLLRRNPLPDRARRSLKTQQHAHLGRRSTRCASRFDPPIPAGLGGPEIDPS